jgi:hypothetical protein
MKEKIYQIITSTNPKKVSQKIKNNSALLQWVNNAYGNSLSEKIYNSISDEGNICKNGKEKKFKSLTSGYGFCSKTKSCECAKESVSLKVSETKSKYTSNQRKEIQEKRIKTNLEKYGITNVGQLEQSKKLHEKIYANPVTVEKINEKIKQTKLARYLDPNYNNSNKIKNTFKQKRQDKFWINKFPEKNITALEDKNVLLNLYKQHRPDEIADILNVHVQTVYRYLNNHNLRDPWKSADELEIIRFLHELGIKNIVRNSRKIIPSKKEIDIFLPDLNIAIEYNGVYWHHEDVAHITRDYHFKKFQECENQNIQLITIFSNFWHSKKEIVKNMLRVKLNCWNEPSIYARNCAIKIVNTSEAKEFLNSFHIQGYTPATTRVGLYSNDTLVALMTFSKSRIGIGKSNTHVELVRFDSKGRIVGGASKLLTFYKKQNPNDVIISYSDNEWSTGNLYRMLGFKLDSNIKYSYWYLKPREHRLYHRFTFSKHKLINQGHDVNKTESQITKELGLLKVWDCGKKKWIL